MAELATKNPDELYGELAALVARIFLTFRNHCSAKLLSSPQNVTATKKGTQATPT